MGKRVREGDVQESGRRTRLDRDKHTFSSSLRFSLKFFRRRAISARRMACSSAVRCFLICGSAKSKRQSLGQVVDQQLKRDLPIGSCKKSLPMT